MCEKEDSASQFLEFSIMNEDSDSDCTCDFAYCTPAEYLTQPSTPSKANNTKSYPGISKSSKKIKKSPLSLYPTI